MNRVPLGADWGAWYALSLPEWGRLFALVNTVREMEMQWAILP